MNKLKDPQSSLKFRLWEAPDHTRLSFCCGKGLSDIVQVFFTTQSCNGFNCPPDEAVVQSPNVSVQDRDCFLHFDSFQPLTKEITLIPTLFAQKQEIKWFIVRFLYCSVTGCQTGSGVGAEKTTSSTED